MSVFDAFRDIATERIRQDEKFGEQSHLSVPNHCRGKPTVACSYAKIPSAGYYRDYYDTLTTLGRMTWAPILMEEVAEAVEAAAGDSRKELREELIQVAAVAVAWVECLDREGHCVGNGIFRRVRV